MKKLLLFIVTLMVVTPMYSQTTQILGRDKQTGIVVEMEGKYVRVGYGLICLDKIFNKFDPDASFYSGWTRLNAVYREDGGALLVYHSEDVFDTMTMLEAKETKKQGVYKVTKVIIATKSKAIYDEAETFTGDAKVEKSLSKTERGRFLIEIYSKK